MCPPAAEIRGCLWGEAAESRVPDKQEVAAASPSSSGQQGHRGPSEVALRPCWQAWLPQQHPEGPAQPRMNLGG